MTKDDGLDPERTARAEEVANWREAGELPFPSTPEPLPKQTADSLDWPPKGWSEEKVRFKKGT